MSTDFDTLVAKQVKAALIREGAIQSDIDLRKWALTHALQSGYCSPEHTVEDQLNAAQKAAEFVKGQSL